MNLKNWVNKKVKKLDWYDITLIKIGTGALVLFLAKVWWPLLSLEWYWYLLIGVVAVIRPAYRAYFKNK
ncbi:hypothetical protein CL621_01935 [archaeon]|nr:hypothetical protein [archaeon]|tara:strand:- start:3335 stop:3541 length:207 start_codon:yes stop_codon:yes gene_type:complete